MCPRSPPPTHTRTRTYMTTQTTPSAAYAGSLPCTVCPCRYGDYKAHFITQPALNKGPLPQCISTDRNCTLVHYDPPLLFNIQREYELSALHCSCTHSSPPSACMYMQLHTCSIIHAPCSCSCTNMLSPACACLHVFALFALALCSPGEAFPLTQNGVPPTDPTIKQVFVPAAN